MRRPHNIPAIALGVSCALLACGALAVLPALRAIAGQSESSASQGVAAAAADLEFFEKRVRPLLVERCHECHSGEKHKANLRLDSRAGLLKGGDTGPAIVPGKPDESLLVDAIRYGETYQMPPKARLPDDEVAVLVDWVRRGAPWPAEASSETIASAQPAPFDFDARARHWCFQPLLATAPPPVIDAAWPRSPIDNFILAGLETRGLTPAAPADQRVWLRRVTYDLIGLPPTPAEITEFLADDSPSSYEKVVDRLLASPHYGERQARHWLDLARFAETYGHEHDYEIPNAYPYRDYLIRAFNADLPYDRLLVEQVAGDLLDPPRRHSTEHFNESIIGTAFFFLGESRHSPVDVREDGATRVDNQIDVFAKTFLALTVGCARCHDHKFDCITQRDYYALAGYLRSSRYQQAYLYDPLALVPTLDNLSTLRAIERSMFAEYMRAVTRPAATRTAAALRTTLQDDEARKKLIPEAARQPDSVLHPWHTLALETPPDADPDFTHRRTNLAARLAEHSQPQPAGTAIQFADFDGPTFADWIATGAAFGFGPGAASDLAPSVSASEAAKTECPARPLTVSAAHSGLLADKLPGVLRSSTFTIEKPSIYYRLWGTGGQVRLIVDGLQLIQDPIYGGLKFGPGGPSPHWHEQRVDKWIGQRAYIELVDEGEGWLALDRVLFDDHAPPAEPANSLVAKMLANPAIQSPADLADAYGRLFAECVDWWLSADASASRSEDSAADRFAIIDAMLTFTSALPAASGDTPPSSQEQESAEKARKNFASLRTNRNGYCALLPPPRVTLAMADGTPENECVFIRGNHRTLGEEVPRRALQVLGGEQHPAPPDASGRRELAEHLVDGSVPLVPRVMVNRIWQRHFGRGIVATPDDFGAMGQRPTHPELLDWLAAEFMRQGWSLKALNRLIVLSSTYRISAVTSPEALAADPENRLWHHMPRRRLEAECIRDAVLAVSGRLDRTMFGPGMAPYLTNFMSGRGKPKESGPLDGAGRRSIYLNVRRNFLSPMLLAFDYPTPFTTIGRRSSSNVPAQALVMLNNPFVAEQATLWARRVLAVEGLSTRNRASAMYVEAFGRLPDAEELAAVDSFLTTQNLSGTPAENERAWSDLAHVLFNAKEFVFVE